MMELKFRIPGKPMGKQRPKFSTFGGHVTARTPKETVNYETLVKLEFQRQCEGLRFADNAQILASVNAYYPIPKSATRKERNAMEIAALRPTKKPDCDNVIKIILDALNGIAYRDDAQVVSLIFNKFYGETPCVDVWLCDGMEKKGEEKNE